MTETYVTGTLGRFVVLYEGLAYWFEMKDQYLYKVTVEQEFFDYLEENKEQIKEKFIYRLINGSILSPKLLIKKRRWYASHAVSKEGFKRIGVELIPEYRELSEAPSMVEELENE